MINHHVKGKNLFLGPFFSPTTNRRVQALSAKSAKTSKLICLEVVRGFTCLEDTLDHYFSPRIIEDGGLRVKTMRKFRRMSLGDGSFLGGPLPMEVGKLPWVFATLVVS